MRKLLISAAALILLAAPAFADPPADRGNRGHEGRQDRGHQDQGRGPQEQPPQAAMAAPTPERGHRGEMAPPQMATQAPRELNRDFNRGERGRMENPAPQMAAPQDRGERNRDFSRGERDRDFGRGERDRSYATQTPPDRGQRDRDYNRGEGYRDFNRGGFDRPDNRNVFNNTRGYRGGDFNREGRGNFRGPRRDFSSFRDFHRDFRAPHRFRVSSYRRPSGWYSHRWSFGEFLPAAFWARDYWLIDFADYDLPPPPYGAVWVRVDRDALLVDEDSGEIITVVYDVFY